MGEVAYLQGGQRGLHSADQPLHKLPNKGFKTLVYPEGEALLDRHLGYLQQRSSLLLGINCGRYIY
jgi:hypothetical protein